MQYTFSGVGAAAAQADDAEVMSIVELSAGTQLTFFASWGKWVKIVDLRVTAPAVVGAAGVVSGQPQQSHQYGLWFTGAKKPGNLYATDLYPGQAGRLKFVDVETVYIQPGTQFQIKTGQQSGAAAEATKLAFTFSYEAPPGA